MTGQLMVYETRVFWKRKHWLNSSHCQQHLQALSWIRTQNPSHCQHSHKPRVGFEAKTQVTANILTGFGWTRIQHPATAHIRPSLEFDSKPKPKSLPTFSQTSSWIRIQKQIHCLHSHKPLSGFESITQVTAYILTNFVQGSKPKTNSLPTISQVTRRIQNQNPSHCQHSHKPRVGFELKNQFTAYILTNFEQDSKPKLKSLYTSSQTSSRIQTQNPGHCIHSHKPRAGFETKSQVTAYIFTSFKQDLKPKLKSLYTFSQTSSRIRTQNPGHCIHSHKPRAGFETKSQVTAYIFTSFKQDLKPKLKSLYTSSQASSRIRSQNQIHCQHNHKPRVGLESKTQVTAHILPSLELDSNSKTNSLPSFSQAVIWIRTQNQVIVNILTSLELNSNPKPKSLLTFSQASSRVRSQ